MVTNYDILILLVGIPQDDVQIFLLYFMSCLVTVIEVMYFLYIFKLIANIVKA